MTANEYQREAARTEASQSAAAYRLIGQAPPAGGPSGELNDAETLRAVRLLHGCIGLCNEKGEITSVIQKRYWYGKGIPDDEFRDKIKDEAGDLCWHLMQILSSQGLTFQEVLEGNIRKLKARYPDAGWSETRAADENRDRAAEAAAVAGQVTVAEQRQIQQAVYGPAAEAARQERARVAVQQGRRILQEQARRPSNVGPQCTAAPAGWQCHRTEGHDGPCAATRTVPGGERPEDPA